MTKHADGCICVFYKGSRRKEGKRTWEGREREREREKEKRLKS